jgi:hypothetical protein
MVIVPMPFESNAGVAHWSAEERRSMRNRLLVLANALQETARRRREESYQCSAKPRPDHRDPMRESSRAVRLAPGEENLGTHLLSLRRR